MTVVRAKLVASRWGCMLVAWGLLLTFAAPPAPAQETKAPEAKPAAPPAAKIAAPKNFSLPMADGLKMKFTYYPGGEGKETVPIVLLHPFNSKRAELKGLAEFLQEGNYAVIVPDLRGHGDSAEYTDAKTSKTVKLTPSRLTPLDFKKIVESDLESLKGFIVKENNAGNLNVKKLCVIGAEMGATLAIGWAAKDWSWEDRGTQRQGKDIRAIVLLEPQSVYKNVPVAPALAAKGVKDEVLFVVLAGNKDPKEPKYSTTKQFCTQLEKAVAGSKKPLPKKEEPKPAAHPRYTLKEFPTTLQGLKLLDNQQVKAGPKDKQVTPREYLDEFIVNALVNRKDEWEQR